MAKKAKNVETKRPRGRPPGQTIPPGYVMSLRLYDADRAALERLAAGWQCTLADAARRAIAAVDSRAAGSK